MSANTIPEIIPALQVAIGPVIVISGVGLLVFIASMAALFGSMIAFLYDINLSLHALRLELQPVKPGL